MNKERLMQVLLSPVVSEKSAMMADSGNNFCFKVASDANKTEIKNAVEMLFEVDVEDVRVLNQKGKTKRFGQVMGKRGDVRKAYVRIKEGQDIDFAGGA
ncbi:MAG: 50S ribosomal protein L23 [Gammaproteobacteria bacterium]|jgi:large subunit ribosomal protein L23|nr:50S ribosomal protein L23 [Gammaproteobacteria bacterium]NNJ92322.1 50S ribosomal protein L23 [Gammaproteobacteria bacterium]